MSIHQPLEIEYWFLQVFAGGNADIFSLLGILVITALGAYFKMSSITYGIFMVMFAAIMAYQGTEALLILLILVFAPILFWWIRRIVE